ncbi:MAG: histidine utilization repressor [Acidiphilium sp.]
MTDHAAAMPLHQQIVTDLEGKILSGAWPPGHRIPFEHELTTQYRCARMTVNKALSALAAAGLITRRRRAGSFVAQPPTQSAMLHIPDLATEIRDQGATYGYRLIKRRIAGVEAAPHGLIGAAWLILDAVHFANDRPFAAEARWINLDAVPDAANVDFAQTPPGSWLLAQVPWTRAAHEIRALNANTALAKTLAVAKDAACLMVERRTWRIDDAITYVRQIFPGDSYRLTAHFSP